MDAVRYMSPEQVRGLPPDERSDVYAAGPVLYGMTAGSPPMDEIRSALELRRAIADGFAPPARLRAVLHLREVIARSLARAPANRFLSAQAFRAALQGSGTT